MLCFFSAVSTTILNLQAVHNKEPLLCFCMAACIAAHGFGSFFEAALGKETSKFSAIVMRVSNESL